MDNMQGTYTVIGENAGIGQALVRELVAQAKFQQAFGHFPPTSHPQAIQNTIQWFRSHKGTRK